MKFLKIIPIIFIFLGIPTYMNFSYAQSKNPNEYKVLSSTNKKLSISDVKDYINEGDKFVKDGDYLIDDVIKRKLYRRFELLKV